MSEDAHRPAPRPSAPRSPWARALAIPIALLLGVAGTAAAHAARTGTQEEVRVHAAYVMNFIRYSRWPGVSDGPLVVSVVGTAGDANVVKEFAARAGPIDGRRVAVRLVPLASIPPAHPQAVSALVPAASSTHVLYLGASHRAWSRAVAASCTGRAVLTVGPGPSFVSAGGMFGMYLDGGNVRFTVNAPAIKASNVDVSARLLMLARPATGR